MNRRNFLKNGSVAGLIITPLAGITATGTEKNKDIFPDDFRLLEMTIDELQQKMKNGELSCVGITKLYLKRIEAIDKNGPAINSVIELNPDALKTAEKMDQERKEGKIRSSLHGIPVLIKDNIDTADQMMTTAGSLALLGNIASEDAFVVQRLREAGAVILGKTNLSEWANFRSTHSCSGWSSRGGQTKNPVILSRNPSGSSSGSGAAVSANLCVVAVGTETDGSVIAPSSNCGIVGIKPTVGLVSRSGIIPISKTQDTAGPMARTVKDAAILLGLIAGMDPRDPVTLQSKGKTMRDYAQNLTVNGLEGKRIGIERSFLEGREEVSDLYKNAIEVLRNKGAAIIEIELLKAIEPAGKGELTVLEYEFKNGVNNYLSHANAEVKTLEDVIEFNKKNAAVAMPFFKQEILQECEKKGDLNSEEYKDALSKSLSSRKIIDQIIQQNQLDAICGTSIGPACLIDLINGDYDTGFYFCPPAAMSGYPHITVPMGLVHGLPVGFSFMAGAYKEAEIIQMAFAFEQATLVRKSLVTEV